MENAPKVEGASSGTSGLSAGFGFTVGQEVTVTRKLWEPPDDCHPGYLLAIPGDRLIVRSFGGSQQHPISVSHHDRTDGMTFFASPDELKPNREGERLPAPRNEQGVMTMENAQTDNSAACGQSRSTVGLGVDLPPGYTFEFHMSNAELAEAIDAAYQRVSKTGQMFDHYPVLQRHLTDLLAIQRVRAGMIETPNDRVQAGEASPATTGSAVADNEAP